MSEQKNEESESKILKLILETGYEGCSSVDSVRELLAVNAIEERDIAEVLGCMARSYVNMTGVGPTADTAEAATWNVENFVTVVQEKAPNIDWLQVFRELDFPHFFLFDENGLRILVRAWKACPKHDMTFPANVFFEKQWENVKGQLTALYQIAIAPTELIDTVKCSSRTVIQIEDFAQSSVHVRSTASQLLHAQLNSLDLIERIFRLANAGIKDDVKSLIDKVLIKKAPELLLLGVAQINPITNDVQQNVLNRLIAFYLEGNANSVLVMTKFWKVKPELFIKKMIELYNKDPTSLTCVLAFVHELKILPTILDAKSFTFTIDLAALATRREYLNLEKWLLDKIKEYGHKFIQACLNFLVIKLRAESTRQETNCNPTTMPLSLDAINVFIKVLMDKVSRNQQEFLNELHTKYSIFAKNAKTPSGTPADQQKQLTLEKVTANTITSTSSPSSITSTTTGGANMTFRQEIENEANSYYERIYSGEITITDMIDRLRKFNISNDPREQELYACMIHNLIDEYTFFPKYPEKELTLTSVLFGQILQNQLLSNTYLGVALQCILDAVSSNASGTKLYNFGVQALTQCQSRLIEWPLFCAHLVQVPQLQQTNPELVQVALQAIQAAKAQQSQQIQQKNEYSTDESPFISANIEETKEATTFLSKPTFTAIHVPEIVEKSSEDENTPIVYQNPVESTQDKILFIINNVALNNLEKKSEELKKNLKESAYQWFSKYLVVKRTSIEPNYHELYLLLLKSIDNRLLYQHVLRETIANIKLLLNSENTVSSSNERTLLKNLGSWLGGLTIARNYPIKQKYISFKDLLLEGFDSNKLIVVIPFVCKVLEQGSKNTVFIPPNPWVMAILKLLVELYEHANLRLNLKFEIEVLCKTLSIELTSIEPTTVLENRKLRDKQRRQPSLTTAVVAKHGDTVPSTIPFAGSPFAMPMSAVANPTVAAAAAIPNRLPLNNLSSPTLTTEDRAIEAINTLSIANHIIFDPQLALYIAAEPQFKRWAIAGITQAIQEIVGPTVKRAVGIATVSTRELVTKDFCMEGDELKLRRAAQTMAQSLAGRLAMVYCQEHLHSSMLHHLVSIFTAHGITDAVAEQISLILIADNLELGTATIEKVTVDRVSIKVDDALMVAYSNRRRHREQQQKRGVLQPYYDMNVLSTSSYPTTLPEPLRPSPLGLQPSQIRIYEDFNRIARGSSSSAASSVGHMFEQQQQQLSPTHRSQQQRFNRTPGMEYNNSQQSNGYGNFNDQFAEQSYDIAQQQSFDAAVTAQQLLERFAQYITELENILNVINVSSLAVVPMNHSIFNIIRQIPMLIIASPEKVELAKGFAQRVIQLLYKSGTTISQEVYVYLLENICNTCPEIGALVTPWLSRANDERKYNVAVTIALIKSNLINLPEHDQELALMIDAGRLTAIDFAARLIRACLFGSMPPVRTRYDFRASLEALNRLRGNVPDSVLLLMDDIGRSAMMTNTPVNAQQNLPVLQQLTPGTLNSNDDDSTVREHMRILFSEWVRIYPTATEKVLNAFTTQLSQQSIFKSTSLSCMFYRVCIEESINYSLNHLQLSAETALIAYQPIDAFTKLVVNLLTLQRPPVVDDDQATDTISLARHSFFERIVAIIVLVLSKHHEQLSERFDQRPFLRLFASLFSDLHAVEQQLQSDYISILIIISSALYTLRPEQYPGFTFGWVQLILHRLFMPKLLLSENQQGWPAFHYLCISLFSFQQPYLNQKSLSNTAHAIYRGTLRVLLVLLHDFPEFLCDYHYSLCDVIPISCVQMRNLVLSAFPRNMRLPDPFTPNLKVDLLPEINHSPTILSDYTASLKTDDYDLKKEIDDYFEKASDGNTAGFTTLVSQLRTCLLQKNNTNVNNGEYNIPLINAMIFYIGLKGVTNGIPVSQGPPVQIYQYLLCELDSEGRYLLLSAIANQLRYPNSHTHYFSCVVLYLFAESKKDIVKEQITRILLERLIVNRPHPWGLLITFIELIKNPRYSFWNHSFTRCATDIERLFESVSRSISQI
ncbi:CCR4-Not complex component, Not1-domain-containing protein [Mycotypha africana]|uniref:CCR4-Not complex component, Not1-domain-containing protein n=1 Tax=Mycotypha africana TaxID=64632 RepID=UPI002300084B|nr:CCR4-Not complex component, Not1-domain-containing protein [Mycotypha africana]KAI8991615.1 CCR4-Not complex component, Not1-domain-containing protein [Mycotypha africana]